MTSFTFGVCAEVGESGVVSKSRDVIERDFVCFRLLAFCQPCPRVTFCDFIVHWNRYAIAAEPTPNWCVIAAELPSMRAHT